MNTKKGFVIEFNVRGSDGKRYPNSVMTSEEFGSEVFNDLTEGEQAGTVSTDKNIEGVVGFNTAVKYDRAFVILN